jgi:HAD superfamily hydrolase (TIGR01509 family)
MRLLERRHWIFDLDGTLTVAVHDFDAIRRELALPAGAEILETLAAMPPAESRPLYARLDRIEQELTRRARPAAGATELLTALEERRAKRGIVTRNRVVHAWGTLQVAGLRRYFRRRDIVGRDEAPPKPSPRGVAALLARWNVAPDDAVVVGDYLFDLQAGRAAGTATILVDASGEFRYREHADLSVRRLDEILDKAGNGR